jgi:hypothetical protein
VPTDLQSAILTTTASWSTFDLSELKISPPDEIQSINFLQRDKSLFIYAVRKSVPSGFLLHLTPSQRVQSFALNTILFHQTILAAFSPCENGICIVSKEGLTVHSNTLKHIFHIVTCVSSCCYYQNIVLLVAAPLVSLSAMKYDYERVNDTGQHQIKAAQSFHVPFWNEPIPHAIFVLSHSIILVSGRPTKVFKIPLARVKLSQYSTCSRVVSPPDNFGFSVFDDCLLVQNRETNECRLFDLFESDDIPIGMEFLGPPIAAIHGSRLCPCDQAASEIRPNYDALRPQSVAMVSALFRRTDGIPAGMRLLREHFAALTKVQDLKGLIDTVGPFARSPLAQLRFVRAIQFSGVLNPHFIMLALLHYAKILGDDMVAEAKIPLVDTMCHQSVKFGLETLLGEWKMRLTPQILEKTMRSGLRIDPRCAENILDYTRVLISIGNKTRQRGFC